MSLHPIEDYAFLSDCRSTALVSSEGSIDWWCVPRIDAPSVFGRLLDPDIGYWELAPTGEARPQRQYVAGTLVLETTWTTETGTAVVTDALALEPGARKHEVGVRSPAILCRQVRGITGAVSFRTQVAPRFEYGLVTPRLRPVGATVEATAGPVSLVLTGGVPMVLQETTAHADFTVTAGQFVDLRIAHRSTYDWQDVIHGSATELLDDTIAAWRSWMAMHERIEGSYVEHVSRSALVLQGLTYARSGAIAAAATTSLPEELGGSRNWDYRCAWLRDLSLTLHALWIAACPDEADALFQWIAHSAGNISDGLVPVMLGLEGERDLTEHELTRLAGYAQSRPVRVGNNAWTQHQLDVAGEVLDAAWQLRDYLKFGPEICSLLVALADRAHADWRRPDAGMWEARDRERHYVSSKVFCWVALDRAVRLGPNLGEHANVERWAAGRDEIRAAVLDQGWNTRVNAFTGAYDSDELDASVLVLPLVGFLDAADRRMRATIEAIERDLGADGTVRRWKDDSAGFFLCSFWLVECLALAGERDRAEQWFDRTVAYAGELGLFAEQMDARTGRQLGNYPQAFSHVALINAAWRLQTPIDTRSDA